MKNTIRINASNGCECELVSNVDNGLNVIELEIYSDVALNPKLYTDVGTFDIAECPFIFTLSRYYMNPSTSFKFRIIDDSHSCEIFTINFPTILDGNLIVKKADNFNYNVSAGRKVVNGIPVATTSQLGGVIVGNTLNITDDGILNANQGESMTPISNIRLEEITGGAAAIIETVPIITEQQIDDTCV